MVSLPLSLQPSAKGEGYSFVFCLCEPRAWGSVLIHSSSYISQPTVGRGSRGGEQSMLLALPLITHPFGDVTPVGRAPLWLLIGAAHGHSRKYLRYCFMFLEIRHDRIVGSAAWNENGGIPPTAPI